MTGRGWLVVLVMLLAGCGSGSAVDGVDKTSAAAPAASAAKAGAGTSTPAASPTVKTSTPTPDVLTVENNPELAQLFAGPPVGDSVTAFSAKYRTKTVEFDGFVAANYINPRDRNGASTINVMAGNSSDPTHPGPIFQLSWYGHDSPLEKFKPGDSVRVHALVGMVYEYEPHQFYLVETGKKAPLVSR